MRLRQVALNLLNNAIKFTTQGAVNLLVCADDNALTVTVRDTGLGICPKNSVDLREFRQSSARPRAGTAAWGWLAICKLLVELHQGAIAVRSSGRGGGSEFSFTLPLLARVSLTDGPPKVCAIAACAAVRSGCDQGQRLRSASRTRKWKL
jgi:two-component system capsular synthesis sensor histidine kinase RcsC